MLAPVGDELAADVEEELGRWAPGTPPADAPLLFRVLARHPDLMSRLRPVAGGLLFRGRLEPQDRELAILRVAAAHSCDREWEAHLPSARAAGLGEDLIAATRETTPRGSGDPAGDLLAAVDAIRHGAAPRAALDRLGARLTADQLVELVVLCGWYSSVCVLLNAAGGTR